MEDDRFAGIGRDDLGFPILPPILELPPDWRERAVADQDILIAELTASTHRHAEVLAERARRFALLNAANDRIPRRDRIDVHQKLDPKWEPLPTLNLLEMNTVYPWIRCFETVVMIPNVTDEQRVEFFRTFPKALPSTMNDAAQHINACAQDYISIRTAFLREYGYIDPVTALLSNLLLQLPGIKSSTQWIQAMNQTRMEIRIAHTTMGTEYTDWPILTAGISAYSIARQQRLHTVLKEKRANPRVYDLITGAFPKSWETPITHSLEAPLMSAVERYNPTTSAARGKRPQRPQRPQRAPQTVAKRPKNGGQERCKNCGTLGCHPSKPTCNAKGIECENCKRVGHFKQFCMSPFRETAETPTARREKKPQQA